MSLRSLALTVSINYQINVVTCLSAGKELRTKFIGVLQRDFFFFFGTIMFYTQLAISDSSLA